MLKFLKNLLAKKEIIKEEVELEKLFDWFTNKTKNEVQEINKKIQEHAESIKYLSKELQKNLIELEKAEPSKGLNIQQRIKQVVDGHRKNYITRLNLFIERIILPEAINHATAKEYCKIVEDELDQIAKNTIKSFYATQHLYHEPLEEVAKDLKNISNLTEEIKKLSKEQRIKKITDIRKDIKEIEKGKNMTLLMTAEMEKTEKRKKALDILRHEVHKQLQEITEGDEYQNYNNLQNKKKELEERKRLQESRLFNIFSPLDASLKKYERMSIEDTKLVIQYMQYPVKALVEDKDLQILQVLEKIKKNVEEGKIDMKEDKKIRTIKAIQNIQAEDLKDFITQYRQSEKELADTEKDISEASGLVIEERKLKDKLVRVEKEMELSNLSNQTMQEKLKNMAFDKTKKDVIAGIKELINIEIEII